VTPSALHLLVLVVVLVVVGDSWASSRGEFDDEDRAWPERIEGTTTTTIVRCARRQDWES